MVDGPMPPDWQQQKGTLEEAEGLQRGGMFAGTPLGWRMLKQKMQPGDELWYFSSPARDWQALAGRAGIALVRAGKVIDELVTRMN